MMKNLLLSCRVLAFFVLAALFALGLEGQEESGERDAKKESAYRSPYSIKYSQPLAELIGDILEGKRGEQREESSVPCDEWDSKAVLERYGAWGPPARHYHRPEGVERRSAQWERERVIAVAMRFAGYSYQHHHIPDWTPPENWPLGQSTKREKGIDCSNFTSFVYNLALGLKPSSDIKLQSEHLNIPIGASEKTFKARRIERPASYQGFAKDLKTGDILFIKNSKGEIGHAVLWVGSMGESPDGTPLVLDSTGSEHKDSNGIRIPSGVHLRPFTEHSWYFKDCSHVLRIILKE